MMTVLNQIALAFIPIFVAVDAIGVMPIFIALTEGLSEKEKKRAILQSMVTALAVALAFIFVGKAIFRFLEISIGDFMVAGGAILFCIAITDILNPVKERRNPGDELGAVPLGTPLIVGPAVLTTSVVIITEYGLLPTVISVILNVLLAGLIFRFSDQLMAFLGKAGAKAVSKVVSLLLAAIAVMLMRKGLALLVGELTGTLPH